MIEKVTNLAMQARAPKPKIMNNAILSLVGLLMFLRVLIGSINTQMSNKTLITATTRGWDHTLNFGRF